MATVQTSVKPESCQQCASPAKYTCPGCLWRTCSLPCIKQHKAQTMCSGQRDKVKYKPMSQLNDLDILNDYRLLEELGRRVEAAGRSGPARGRQGAAAPLRPYQYRLRRAAKRRGVRLDFLPEGFGRRLDNTSQLEADTGRLLWRVEWRLPLADAVRADDRVPDTSRLSEVLTRHLSDALAPEDPLQFYRAAFESRTVRVFLQAERVQQGHRYIELPVNKTLEACLKDRLVIEFPILVVTTEEHAAQYREDVIEESFFSLCRQEEEQRRRCRRAERRRGPAAAPEPDEPGRKVPRPRLDGVAVVARPEPQPGPEPEPGPPTVEPQSEQEQEQEPQPQRAAAEQPAEDRTAAAAVGFGLFGVGDSDLSD